MDWQRLDPLRIEIQDLEIVVQRFSPEIAIAGAVGGYDDPMFSEHPPPNQLFASSRPLAGFEELAALLCERAIDLVAQATGREEALADLFLAVDQRGDPFWRSRLPGLCDKMDGPGAFEREYGLNPREGNPRLDGDELVFWTLHNAFLRWHLPGIQEIRWNLRSLAWRHRQLR